MVVQSLVVGLDAAWSLFASTLSKMQFTLAQIARKLSPKKLSWANPIHFIFDPLADNKINSRKSHLE